MLSLQLYMYWLNIFEKHKSHNNIRQFTTRVLCVAMFIASMHSYVMRKVWILRNPWIVLRKVAIDTLCKNPWIAQQLVVQTIHLCWRLQFIAKQYLFHSKYTNNYLLNKNNMCFTSKWAWTQLTSLNASYQHPYRYTQLAIQLITYRL